MRARSLKPGLFKNELLGAADPLLTILFEGLWCMADREGRLEDRPLRICAEIFPYRRSVTEKKADSMLTWLHNHVFIVRYEVCKKRYIQIVEFLRHQRPHVNEGPSIIQSLSSPEALPRKQVGTTKETSEHNQGDKHFALTPDSGLLTPSSLTPESRYTAVSADADTGSPDSPRDPNADQAWFEAEIQRTYPRCNGRRDWFNALRYARSLVEEGAATWPQLLESVSAYVAHISATGTDAQHTLTPQNFFGTGDAWAQERELPKSKADKRLATNLSAADEFLRSTEGR